MTGDLDALDLEPLAYQPTPIRTGTYGWSIEGAAVPRPPDPGR